MFEYDPNKSLANKEKHGIDFEEAQSLWLDPRGVEINARTVGESRKLLIARLDKAVWSAIFTLREGVVRIISVRKSRENEKKIYYDTRI
ncbi:MAG: BrnT family toxin [Mangrovibacterium sp.]